ncbi:MAG: osmoprotectant transport system substrate-binding protein [Chloroflexota bacterium]|nr:osmoprotectant transport system substrate-binding protein [Chloroflexota bacterium]
MRFQRLFLAMTVSALFLGACTPSSGSSSAQKPPVTIGSTNFSEQVLLGEMYAQVLEANGYTVTRKFNLGNRQIVEPAIENGEIDMYPEYLASMLLFVDKNATAPTDAPGAQKALQTALTPKNITVLDPAPAIDTNGFVVTKATADKYKLAKMSDLTPIANQLTLGAAAECPQNAFCIPGLQRVYGLTFKDFKPLDPGGSLTVAAIDSGQVDVGELFTTDATISIKGYVLLDDDKHLQAADNVAPVVRNDFLSKAPADFKTLVNSLTTKLTTAELTDLNKQVNIDKKEAKDVATVWLKSKGLLK